MSDDDAYMALALNNAQGELHPLEVGLHALNSGLDQKTYAEKAGQTRTTLQRWWYAAELKQAVPDIGHDDGKTHVNHLAEIHAAPRWLWKALVSAMLAHSWTVEATRKAVASVQRAEAPPEWANVDAIAGSSSDAMRSQRDADIFDKPAARSADAFVTPLLLSLPSGNSAVSSPMRRAARTLISATHRSISTSPRCARSLRARLRPDEVAKFHRCRRFLRHLTKSPSAVDVDFAATGCFAPTVPFGRRGSRCATALWPPRGDDHWRRRPRRADTRRTST